MPTRRAWSRSATNSIERAIELNGAAVAMNLAAFRWGRRAAHDRAGIDRLVAPADDKVVPFAKLPRTLDEIVASRVKHLTGYQNAAPRPSATRRWSRRCARPSRRPA